MGIPALFETRGGIRIGAEILSIAGSPGLGDAYSDTAVKGALCLDETNGQLYQKKMAGSGADKWVRLQNQDDVNAAIMGQAWRPPARIMDDSLYADMAAAETVLNTGSMDGISVVENDRLLLTNITTANANVFTVSGTPGAGATLVEDSNDASKGDALYVQEGSHAGAEMGFNGSLWVQQGKASVTELSHIQTFIGKSANGAETPDYGSNHVVSDTDPLEKAIGDLDAEMGGAIATPQSRSIGAISDQAINLNLEALDDAIGATVTSTQHISSSNDLNSNISILDKVLADARSEEKSDSVTTLTTLDTFPVDTVLGAEWTVHARSAATASNIWAGKLLAIHNGTASADASSVDYNTFAILKTGNTIPALTFECDLEGAGVAQVVRLRASSGEAVHIRLTRSIQNEQ